LRLPDPDSVVPVVVLPRISQAIPDDDLKRLVVDRLLRLGRKVVRRLSIEVIEGAVVLSGRIDTVYEKQIVLQAIRQLGPVQTVRDHIEVSPDDTASAPAEAARHPLGSLVRFVPITSAAALCLGAVVGLAWLFGWAANRHTGLVPLQSTVEVKGEPAVGAFLALHPVEKNSESHRLPRGLVGLGGAVEWTTYRRGDGLPAGDYVVVALWNRPVVIEGELQRGPNLLSEIYRSPATSPLRIRVSSESPAPLRLQIP